MKVVLKDGSGFLKDESGSRPKSPKADNLRRGWMRGFQAFLREQQPWLLLNQ